MEAVVYIDSSVRSSLAQEDIPTYLLKCIAVVSFVLFAYLIQILVKPLLATESPYLLFFASITLSAWLGGLRLGLLATGCAALLVVFKPASSPIFSVRLSPGEAIQLGLFVLEGALISFITYRLRIARKQTVQALHQNEELFHLVLKSAKISVYTNDRNLRYTWIYNPHPDFTAGEMIGKRDDELLPPESVAELIALKQEVLATGKLAQKHISTRIHDQQYTFAVTVEPVRSSDGELQGIAVATMDVTDSERMQAELRESEELRRLALDAAEMGAWVNGISTDFVYWDEQTRQIFGVQPDEPATLDKRLSIIHPDDRPRALEALEHAIQPGSTGTYEIEKRIVHPDQEIRWIATKGRVIYDTHGNTKQPSRIVGIVRDITQQKLAQNKLGLSEERLRLAKLAARLGVFDYDIASGTIEWDIRTREIWGVGQNEAITYDVFLKGIHPEDKAPTDAAVQQSLNPDGDGEFFAEYRVINRVDHFTRWVVATGQVVFEANQPLRMIGTVQEITERKRAEQQSQLLQILGETFLSAVSTQDVTDTFIQQCAKSAITSAVVIAILTEDETQLEVIGALGYSEDVVTVGSTIPLDHPTTPIARAVREYQSLWLCSIEEREDVFGSIPDRWRDPNHRSWAVLPFKVSEVTIGVFGFAFNQPNEFDDAERSFLTTLKDYFAQAWGRAMLTEKIRHLAQQEERQRLSRDLHDSVQQILFASRARAEALPTLWEKNSPSARKYTDEIVTLNQAALAEMRTLLLEMRPKYIARTPFMSLLDNLCRGLSGREEIKTELQYNGPDELYLSEETHVALYRLAQEALNNVVKHSQAKHLTIVCRYDKHSLYLLINDDGTGFDVEQTAKGIGLTTMHERAQAIGADLKVTSTLGQGTRILVKWETGACAATS